MNYSNHIIEKVFLEVNTSSVETAHSINNNIDLFIRNELYPELEVLFEKHQFGNEIIRFDQLSLNLTLDNLDDFNELKLQLIRQLDENIKLQIMTVKESSKLYSVELKSPEKYIQQISSLNNSEDIFLFFLENGYLPWFGKEVQLNQFRNTEFWENIKNEDFLLKLDHLIKTNEYAAERFYNQFSDEIITEFHSRKNFRIKDEKAFVLKISKKLSFKARSLFLKLLSGSTDTHFPGYSELFKRLIFEILNSKLFTSENEKSKILNDLEILFQKLVPKPIFKDSDQPEKELENTTENLPFLGEDTSKIWVQNAGLILLHPFLKAFFAATKITDNQSDLSSKNYSLAVQSLHFLATENENVFEGNLVFEKFLCGIPLKMPVQQISLLTDSIKSEATDLLLHVVKNWPALKNTSAHGLRESFLMRPGKLTRRDDDWLLQFEPKTLDILLDQLPWSIGIIKLPWINKLIHTEWH